MNPLEAYIANGTLPAPAPVPTPAPPPTLKRVRWNHAEIIDFMIANPQARQREIAAEFGLSESWLSICINSDSFKAALQERRAEIVDPRLTATIDDRLSAVAAVSMEMVLERLQAPLAPSDTFLTNVAKMSLEAMGFGSKGGQAAQGGGVQVIVNVPGKAASTGDWSERWSRPPLAQIVEVKGDSDA